MLNHLKFEEQLIYDAGGVMRITPSPDGKYYASWDFPEGSAQTALAAVDKLLSYLFRDTLCLVVHGTIMKDNRTSRIFTAARGFVSHPSDVENAVNPRLDIKMWAKKHRLDLEEILKGKPWPSELRSQLSLMIKEMR